MEIGLGIRGIYNLAIRDESLPLADTLQWGFSFIIPCLSCEQS